MSSRRRRAGAEASADQPRGTWQWRTFPVAFAFALGALVFAVLAGVTGAFGLWFFVALFGVSFGVAHMITRSLRAYRDR
jgi:hypothetical protein